MEACNSLYYVFPFVFIGKYSLISWHDNFEIVLNHLISLGNVEKNQSAWTTLSTSGTNIFESKFKSLILSFLEDILLRSLS